MVSQRPWWRGVDVGHRAYRDRIFFATGGLYLARAEFLRRHNFPDRAILQWRDDVMLSDLCNQQGGALYRFTKDVNEHVVIDAGDRRGENIKTILPARPEDFHGGI